MRILNTGFVFLFMLMLLLPLVCVDLSSGRTSEKENRMLADLPALAEMKNHPARFIRGFEAWFKDSTGFRESMVEIYKTIDKMGPGIRYTDGSYVLLIGRQGHRFFAHADGWMIAKFQGKKSFFSDEQITALAQRLEEVREYLAEKNIPFIVMLCTDKESVYPEYYPPSIKRGPEPIELDRITRYVQNHTGVDIFNIRQALAAEKGKYPVYPVSRGDLTHYSQIGAFFAYRELMRHINASFPDITPLNLDDITISYDSNGNPAVSLNQKSLHKELDTTFFDNVDVYRPFTWENAAFENTNADTPSTILVMRDSYTNFITEYLAQHFGRIIYIHYQNMGNFDKYIAEYQPDIVVFEAVERQLDWFGNCVMNMPKLW